MNNTHDLNMGYNNYMWPTDLNALNDELTLGIEALIDPGGGGNDPPYFFKKIYYYIYIYALNLAILFFKITFCPFNNIFDFFCSNVIVANLPTTFL